MKFKLSKTQWIMVAGVLVSILGIFGAGFYSGTKVDNRNAIASPVIIESPNSTVNFLEGKDSLLREYLDMSRFYLNGADILVKSPLVYQGDLFNILQPALVEVEGGTSFKCDLDSLQIYRKVINFEPRFPFSYFMLSDCMRRLGQDGWVSYAEHAVKILEVTTSIAGHRSEHEEVLVRLRVALEN